MVNRYVLIYTLITLFALVNLGYQELPQKNHRPSVKIIAPVNNTMFKAGTPVNYQLSVTDKEDGDSKYDEINSKEVLLEVRYVNDKSKIPGLIAKTILDDPPGLTTIRTSNCFNCHNFKGRSIGPSFFEISKRYPSTKSNIDSLVKSVKNGSAGLWGKGKMPSHPELTVEEIKGTVKWILKNATAQDINYYIGMAGVIQFPAGKNGVYMLTASYTDHGSKNASAKHLKGAYVVVMSAKL
jgi:cytochrome c